MIYEKLILWKEMKQYFVGTKLIIIGHSRKYHNIP